MVPTSPNPYISRKLNNIDQAQVTKKEREDWMRLYHKMLKGIEAMINVQRMLKNMKKIAEETRYNSHRDGRNNPDSQYQ